MLYIPSLRKNLILVGALESEDLKVTMENGILKITKGTLIVMIGIGRNL